MKNANRKKEYFSARIPVWITVACAVVALLGVATVAVCVWRIVRFNAYKPWDVIKYVFLFPVGAFCMITALSVVFRSGYTITQNHLLQTFGLFRVKIPVAEIKSLLLNSDENKLTVYANEQTIAVLIAGDNNEKFARALLKVNPDIDYGFTLANKPEENE